MKDINFNKLANEQRERLFKGECKIRLEHLYDQISQEQKGIELFEQQLGFIAKYMNDAKIQDIDLRRTHPDIYKFRFKVTVELEKRKGRLARLLKEKEERENKIKGEIYGIC